MTSSQYGPYALGHTRVTIPTTEGCQTVRRSQSQKSGASSDRGLQFALVKPESLVSANQTCCAEYVPRSCTHRPSSQPSRLHPKPLTQLVREGGVEGVIGKED
jgi:hypothetical protein